MRVVPQELSFLYRITLSFTGSVKLGQPVPESNFVILSKSFVPQQIQSYTTGANNSLYSPLKACSVPCPRVIRNCSGVTNAFHSSSVFVTFLSGSRFACVRPSTSFHVITFLVYYCYLVKLCGFLRHRKGRLF